MKTSIRSGLFFCAFFFASTLSTFAQGILTPPGAPAPTMKSLDQIEPRTPISSLPVIISTGGGYYLTKNLNIASGDAIIIAVNGVTLDLNGFEITSSESSPAHSGIVINGGLRNIRIMNGAIRGNVTLSGSSFSGSGFANGIQANPGSTTNTHVSDVAVSGCLANGINLGNSGLVESCTVSVIGSLGIQADTVIYSNAYQFGIEGIFTNNATGCYVNSSASTTAAGISAGLTAIGCVALCNATSPNGAIATKVARDCYAVADSGAGDALLANTAENCNGFALGTGSGIHCSFSASNCYGTSSGSAAAVNVTGGTALNCYGVASGSGNGLSAGNAENSTGLAGSGTGVVVTRTALNCYGTATGTNPALSAGTAENCYAVGSGTGDSGGHGLSATIAKNCYGQGIGNNSRGILGTNAENSVGISPNSIGIAVSGAATNCYAEGLEGVDASIANGCYGKATGLGIRAVRIAVNCWGKGSLSNGAGIQTDIAVNCEGDAGGSLDGVAANTLAIGCTGSSFGQVVNSPHKYNEPQ